MKIKAGDLVMVVRPARCGCASRALGQIFTVSGLYHGCHCSGCKAISLEPCALVDGKWVAFELWRLKKIEPLNDPEEAQTKVEREEKKRVPA